MSNFKRLARHPNTKKLELADWIDDYFGRHHYGVRFPDGLVFSAYSCLTEEQVNILATIPDTIIVLEEGIIRPIKFVRREEDNWDRYVWAREWEWNDNVGDVTVLNHYDSPHNQILVPRDKPSDWSAGFWKRVIEVAEQKKHFATMEDGFYYYFSDSSSGALTAGSLRVLADELDRRNRSWTEQIEKDLGGDDEQ